MRSSHIITLQQNIETQMKNQETEGPKSTPFLHHLHQNAYEQSLALVGSQFQNYQNQLHLLNSKINFLRLHKERSAFYGQNQVDLTSTLKSFTPKQLKPTILKNIVR